MLKILLDISKNEEYIRLYIYVNAYMKSQLERNSNVTEQNHIYKAAYIY